MIGVLRHHLIYGSSEEVELSLASLFTASLTAYGPAGVGDPIEDGQVGTVALTDQNGTGPISVRYRIRGGGAWITEESLDSPDFAADTTEFDENGDPVGPGELQGPDTIEIEAFAAFSDASTKVIIGTITVNAATEAPTVVDPIDDITGFTWDSNVEIDLDTVFNGQAGRTYAFVGGPASAVLSGVRNETLIVSRMEVVSETVTVRCTDANGTVDDVFDVNVVASIWTTGEELFGPNDATIAYDTDLGRLWMIAPLIGESGLWSRYSEDEGVTWTAWTITDITGFDINYRNYVVKNGVHHMIGSTTSGGTTGDLTYWRSTNGTAFTDTLLAAGIAFRGSVAVSEDGNQVLVANSKTDTGGMSIWTDVFESTNAGVSFDAGTRFESGWPGAINPDVAIDPITGTAHLVYGYSIQPPPTGEIDTKVYRKPSGGVWSSAQTIDVDGHARARIDAYNGRVVVTLETLGLDPPMELGSYTSDDDGVTWSSPLQFITDEDPLRYSHNMQREGQSGLFVVAGFDDDEGVEGRLGFALATRNGTDWTEPETFLNDPGGAVQPMRAAVTPNAYHVVTIPPYAGGNGMYFRRAQKANAAPTVASAIADQETDEGDPNIIIDLDTVFTDDEGVVNLRYSIVGGSTSCSLSGDRNETLTLSSATDVAENVTVRATDLFGATVDDTFAVLVNDTGGGGIVWVPFFADTFDEAVDMLTSSGSHTPELGTGWTNKQNNQRIIATEDAATHPDATSASRVRITDAIPSGTYKIVMEVRKLRADGGFAGIGVRTDNTGLGFPIEITYDTSVGGGSWLMNAETLAEAWPGGTVRFTVYVTPERIELWIGPEGSEVLKVALDDTTTGVTGTGGYCGMIHRNTSTTSPNFVADFFEVYVPE